jgi:hypothetical protein
MTDAVGFSRLPPVALGSAATAAVLDTPKVIAQPKIQWRMSTSWTPVMTVRARPQRLAKLVEDMSGGRFRIEVFPVRPVMQAFECFDAASNGTIEGVHAARTNGTQKEPAVEWFTTVPFGMNAEGMSAWYTDGDGSSSWEEASRAIQISCRGPDRDRSADGRVVPERGSTPLWIFKGLKMACEPRRQSHHARGRHLGSDSGRRHLRRTRTWNDRRRRVDRTARRHDARTPQDLRATTTIPAGTSQAPRRRLLQQEGPTRRSPIEIGECSTTRAAAVDVYGHREHHAKNAIALDTAQNRVQREASKCCYSRRPVLRDLKKLASEEVADESERSPMGRKVHTLLHEIPGAWLDRWDQRRRERLSAVRPRMMSGMS